MRRTFSILVKTAVLAGLAFLAFRWLSFFLPWARTHVGTYGATLSVACSLLSTATASLAVILLNSKNAGRIARNVFIIFGCFAAAFVLGGYIFAVNRGFGEGERGLLVFGVIGTLIGYCWTLLREINAANAPQPQGGSPLRGSGSTKLGN